MPRWFWAYFSRGRRHPRCQGEAARKKKTPVAAAVSAAPERATRPPLQQRRHSLYGVEAGEVAGAGVVAGLLKSNFTSRAFSAPAAAVKNGGGLNSKILL